MVHEASSPLYNGEIQQAVEMVLVSPDYAAIVVATSADIIGENNTPGQYSIVLRNEGLLNDSYNINCFLDGPAGWTGEFTTVNGTFPFGQIDSVEVAADDSTNISLTISPNGFSGSGTATLEFESRNAPGIVGSVTVSFVTTTGVDILVVDASEDGYGEIISNTLPSVYSGNFGMVSREALHAPGVNLSNFYMIAWSAGVTLPVFYQAEVNALQQYLDAGGRLFINGQDIGADIFEASGQSQFAQSFYNNYLHADYIANTSNVYLINGYDGDPITDGLVFVLSGIYDRSPESISPFDADATPILKYSTGPQIGAVRASTTTHRIVYLGIGLEQIGDEAARDSIIARSVRWLTEGLVSADNDGNVVKAFNLEQN
jgi:hypothetical protein